MGIIGLALFGGAAYYAGKKLNEPHYDAQGNIIYDPRQASHRGWCQRKQWHRERHQQQQSDPSQYPNQGMTRDAAYQDYTEKPAMTQRQPQHVDYPSTYYDHPQSQSRAYYNADSAPAQPRDIKQRPQSPVQTKQMVRIDTTEVPTTPPAYGYSGRPLSPQQRMYAGNNGGLIDNAGRSESAPPQQVYQQMEFKEPQKGWSVDKLMWKS